MSIEGFKLIYLEYHWCLGSDIRGCAQCQTKANNNDIIYYEAYIEPETKEERLIRRICQKCYHSIK